MVIFARIRVMTDRDSGGKLYHYLINSSGQGKSLTLWLTPTFSWWLCCECSSHTRRGPGEESSLPILPPWTPRTRPPLAPPHGGPPGRGHSRTGSRGECPLAPAWLQSLTRWLMAGVSCLVTTSLAGLRSHHSDCSTSTEWKVSSEEAGRDCQDRLWLHSDQAPGLTITTIMSSPVSSPGSRCPTPTSPPTPPSGPGGLSPPTSPTYLWA